MKRWKLGWILFGSGVAMALPIVRTASACGGTFCDGGSNSMPVDQTGENILFVLGEDFVEAHIQIQYDPDTTAQDFAWVIPLQSLPEFSVGSEPLFTSVLAASVPQYGFSTVFDQCGGSASSTGASSGGESGGSDGSFIGEPDGGGGGPDVVYQATVGAFEITVLQGGTADEVITWLDANGYQQDPEAEPILAEYLAENFLFAAFKLKNGVDVSSIHPVVLRFEGREACVPLRLTRIAAKEDMDVRTFFLSELRVVPRNYRHVLVNPLKIDWLNFAANYKSVISLAVDADQADGHAFVTEYAGTSSIVGTGTLWSASWDPAAFTSAMAIQAIDLLTAQSLLVCYDDGAGNGVCDYLHPLIRGVLLQYLPPPVAFTGTPEDFWAHLADHEDEIDAMAWDGAAFSADLQQRIVDPGGHAVDLLETWPYLTRMYTTISPGEMTEDPLFWENPDLLDVSNVQNGTLRVLCSADQVFTLPDGREVFLPVAGGPTWPDFPDEMPWVEDVEAVTQAGGPMNLVDNTATIDALLRAWNESHDWPGTGSGGESESGSDSSSDSGSGSGSGSESGSGTGTSGTSATSGEETGAGADQDEPSTSCACDSKQGSPMGAAALGLLGLGLAGRRRRRS